MGNCHDFDSVIEDLSEFCCLVLDLPGHGQTEVVGDDHYQMPQIAQAVIGLLTELKIKQCILVGYSMGGRIALYLAIYFPEYFYGVVLESASPGLSSQLERDRRIVHDANLAKQLELRDLADFIHRWYQNPLFKSFVEHPHYQQAIAQRLQNNSHKLAKSLRFTGLGQQPNLAPKLPEIQMPLLLIVGELDTKFMHINRMMANSCPQASLSIVNHVGHNVHFEHPTKFSRLLQHFVILLLSSTNPK